jgi:hypothetical protein
MPSRSKRSNFEIFLPTSIHSQHPYDTIDPTASSSNVREIQMGWDDMEKPLSGSPLHLPTPRQTVKVSALATSRVFEPNASIVLVGTRGCGKTSLGYIAARALGRRLVEADDEFKRKTGLSRAQFLKNNGRNAEEYRLQERKVMETMVANNEQDAVIVCGLGSIESHGQMLVKRFANTHPVLQTRRP